VLCRRLVESLLLDSSAEQFRRECGNVAAFVPKLELFPRGRFVVNPLKATLDLPLCQLHRSEAERRGLRWLLEDGGMEQIDRWFHANGKMKPDWKTAKLTWVPTAGFATMAKPVQMG
jgi:hypothetical protein